METFYPHTNLFFALYQKTSEGLQRDGTLAEAIESLAGFSDEGIGFTRGFFNSE